MRLTPMVVLRDGNMVGMFTSEEKVCRFIHTLKQRWKSIDHDPVIEVVHITKEGFRVPVFSHF